MHNRALLAVLAVVALTSCKGRARELASDSTVVPPSVPAQPNVSQDADTGPRQPTITYPLPRVAAALRLLDARLVDSVPADHWSGMGDSVFTYRFALRTDAGEDTVGNLIDPSLVVVGDSLVLGIVFDAGIWDRLILRVRVGQSPSLLHLPSDLWPFFHDLAISPDGRHLLYLASVPGGNEQFTVQDLTTGSRLWSSSQVPGCDCDVDRHHARWVASDTFQVARMVPGGRRWEVLSVPLQGSVSADTSDSEPSWHQR